MKLTHFLLAIFTSLFLLGHGSVYASSDAHGAPPHKKTVSNGSALLDLGGEMKKEKKEVQAKQATLQAEKKVEKHKKQVGHDKVHKPHWSYAGAEGPAYWGELTADYSTCKTGKNQSPVNLSKQTGVGTTSLPGFDVRYRDTPLKIINNGHTVQINYPLGSFITINEHRYELLQFHFHTPSEHQLNGFNYPMEMHMVHKDAEGNLAVIGVIFREGRPNMALQKILEKLPKEVGKQHIYENTKINANKFFPLEKRFYKYSGSLTTPPCSQGVYWMVFQRPLEASASQIAKMMKLLGENNRPIQKPYARTILKSWADNDPNETYDLY